MKGTMKNILVVEDDRSLCRGIAMALQTPNLAVFTANTCRQARAQLQSIEMDLLILDIGLPDGSGLDLLREIKARGVVSVILLTANDTESDVVLGLESGADDYITKPFSLAILRARVNARLRSEGAPLFFCQDNFRFDFDKMEFTVQNCAVELSKTEQKLLKVLIENKGITLKRTSLVDFIWPQEAAYVDENALSVTVKRLRAKLGKDNPIKTVYGIGYRWEVKQNEQNGKTPECYA